MLDSDRLQAPEDENMAVLIKVCVILSNILGTFSISHGYFVRFNGYKLAGAFSILNLNFRIKCAENCLATSCLSFNYHSQTGECQLNTDSPYTNTGAVLEAAGWAIYHLQKKNDWELVFRAQANNSLSPYQAWMGTLSLPTPIEDGCRLLTETFTCVTIYRSDVIDSWASENITEVQLELYRGGNRVLYVRFDGRGSTFTNWFSVDTCIDSSWNTLSVNNTFNFFSITGQAVEGRRFFINRNYGGCSNDKGWLVVKDILGGTCVWDKHTEKKPAFLFSPTGNGTQWQNFEYEDAEVFAVFIKR